MSAGNPILSRIHLQEQMLWVPGKTIFHRSIYQMYVSEEYKNSSRKDTDEVYRMSEMVAVHKASGLRLSYVVTENYNGDSATYKLVKMFIVTNDGRILIPTDINLKEKYFNTSEGEMPFSGVRKYANGD